MGVSASIAKVKTLLSGKADNGKYNISVIATGARAIADGLGTWALSEVCINHLGGHDKSTPMNIWNY